MSSVEIVSALERRLNAAIPQQAIRGEVAARLKKIGRTAKISGFRPGKIPPKILEQYYGAQAHQEVLGEILHRSFADAAQSNNLRVVGHPQFEINADNADQIEYSAIFEVYPEVVLADLPEETIERLACELTQEDVESTITTLRKQRITYESVGRAAEAGDQVCIDFSGKIDGEIFPGGEARDYAFVLGAGRMLPEFEAAITGMMMGDIKSFDMTFPDDYPGKDMAGRQVSFTITLHKVEAPNMPEVDAEFAESVGIEDGNVGMLESEVKINLQREMVRRLKLRNKEAAMNALFRASRFGVPSSLVRSEAQSLMQQTMQDMQSRGLTLADSGLTPELFFENAERRVKLGLIIADLAQKHDLRARPEQVRTLVEDYAQSFDEPEDVVRWFYTDASQIHEVENLVLEENVVNWTMGQAKTVDKTISFNDLMGN